MMIEAIFGGMLIMYAIAGAYIGVMLPVRRRRLAVLLCMLIWPLMLWDIEFKPEPKSRR